MKTFLSPNKRGLVFLSTAIIMCCTSMSYSQGVGINDTGANPNPNAILDADASTNDKGILIPRISSGQRAGIAGLGAAEEGLTVYDETTNSYWLWDGTQWLEFLMSDKGWRLRGNTGTTPGTDFLGTTDAQDLVVKTNNTERIRVYSTGEFEVDDLSGVGTRMVVADANGELNTQAIPANGDITSVVAGNGLTGGGTTGAVTLTVAADNGLYINAGADRVRMGGALVENTTVTQGGFQMTYNLNGTGDFNVQDNGTTRFQVLDNGRIEMSGTTDATGTANSGVLEIGNSLRIDGNEMITNTDGVLYLQNDNNGDLMVDGGTLMVDASVNRVGIGTGAPSRTLDVNGTVRIRGGAPTAGDFLMSQDGNGNATWSAAGYGLIPIGSIVGWHGNMAGVPGLPTGWVECNGQLISDAASPMNGQNVPNLNGPTTSASGDASRGRFLRGHTTSGLLQEDQANNLYWINHDDSGNGDTDDYLDDDGTTVTIRNYSTSGDRFQARLQGIENRVTNMTVRWIIRIK